MNARNPHRRRSSQMPEVVALARDVAVFRRLSGKPFVRHNGFLTRIWEDFTRAVRAGENLKAGTLVSIGDDGKAYRAAGFIEAQAVSSQTTTISSVPGVYL